MEVNRIIKKRYKTIDAWEGIHAARKLLLEEECLVVLDNEEYKGLLTADDLAIAYHQVVIDCLRDVPAVDWHDDIEAAFKKMQISGRAYLPVFRDQVFAGILDKSHVLCRIARNKRSDTLRIMISSVQHALNNALVGVKNYAELLSEVCTACEDGKRYASVIHKSAERAASFVHSMNFLSDANGEQRNMVDIQPMLKIAAGKTLRLHPHLDLRIVFNSPSHKVYADPLRLMNAFDVIITNAAEAMEGEGILDIHTDEMVPPWELLAHSGTETEANKYLRILIRDTGAGIAREVARHIFEPFFTTKESKEHLGLSLAMAQLCIEGHAGYIDVESEPGEGACFRILLPRAAEDKPQAAQHSRVDEALADAP